MMRKLSLFLLGLLIWGAAYSTPASILQYKVEPTEDQKTEFFRRAREDPELYSYNPLHVGNKWWRSLSSGGYQLIREVVASTEINGNVYYKVIGLLGSGENHWIRNEGDITYAYDEFDLDNNPDTDEIIHENFSSVGSFYVFHFLDDWPYPWICTSDGEHYLSHYYIPTYIRFHEYWAPGWATSHHTRGWARGFGPTYEEWDDQPDNVMSSAACEINGVHYGQPVSVYEPMPPSIALGLSCFPNPFKDAITISYIIPDRSKTGTLSIFNIKGQLIISIPVNGDGAVKWDGRNESGKLLPSGVYYCSLRTQEGSKLSKLILIK
jgi:hypothetical protein